MRMNDELFRDYFRLHGDKVEDWNNRVKNIANNVVCYVYEHYLDGELFYIGKGKGLRGFDLDGRSERWKLYVDGREDEVLINIAKTFKLELHALRYEAEHISSCKDEYSLVNSVLYEYIDKEIDFVDDRTLTDYNKLLICNHNLNQLNIPIKDELSLNLLFMILANDTNEDVVMTYKNVRTFMNKENLQAARIKESLYELSNCHIEIDNKRVPILSNFELINKIDFSARLNEDLLCYIKLRSEDENIVCINVEEYVKLKLSYSKRMYQLLSQFRDKGELLINRNDFIKIMNPPISYNEYTFIRKVLIPSIEANRAFFEDLEWDNASKSRLPNMLRFSFKEQDVDKMLEQHEPEEVDEECLFTFE